MVRMWLPAVLVLMFTIGAIALYRASGEGPAADGRTSGCKQLIVAIRGRPEAGADDVPAFHPRFAAAWKALEELGEDGPGCLKAAVGHPEVPVRTMAMILASYEDVLPRERVREWLSDEDPRVRSGAALALGRTPQEGDLDGILGLLDDPEPDVRRAAVRALRGYGGYGKSRDPMAARCITALKDPDPGMRGDAAATLGVLKVEAASVPIMDLLDDPNDAVRVFAIYALKNLQCRQAVPDLLRLVPHGNDEVAVAAMLTLGVLRSREAAPVIRKRLDGLTGWQRASALRALANIEGTEETRLAAERAEEAAPARQHHNNGNVSPDLRK